MLGLLGLWLLYWSLLKDRAKGRRRCPKCWYDMSATEGLRCSECGYEAKREKNLHKTRRRKLIAAFALITFISGGVISSWPLVKDFDWITVAPIWLLKHQGDLGSPQGLAARKELARRLGDGLLSAQEIRDLVEHALAMQADPNSFWPNYRISRELTWGILVELAWEQEQLSKKQLERYFRNAIDMTFTIEPRKIIRSGSPLPVQWKTDPPRLSNKRRFLMHGQETISTLGEVESITIGDIKIPFRRNPIPISQLGMGGWMTTPVLDCDLPPGKHTIRFEWDFAVRKHIHGQLHFYTPTLEPDPADLVHWKKTYEYEFEVVPSEQTLVQIIDDPAIHDEIRDAIQLEFIEKNLKIGGTKFGGRFGMILFDTVPMDLSFDVFARADGIEKKFGSIFVLGGVKLQNTHRLTNEPKSLFPNATSIDVIFRTNIEAAERTIDCTSVWDGEIVIENVPLVKSDLDK